MGKKKIRCKKYLGLAIIFLFLVGCASEGVSASKDPRQTVVRYFDNLCAGNRVASAELCVKDSNPYKKAHEKDNKTVMDAIISEITSDPDEIGMLRNSRTLNKMFDLYNKNMYESYQISDYMDLDDETVVYHVIVNRLLEESVDMTGYMFTHKSFEDYLVENEEYAEEQFNLGNDGAVIVDFISKEDGQLANDFEKYFENSKFYEAVNYDVVLQKQEDGVWLISEEDIY